MEYYFHIKPTFDCVIKIQNISSELYAGKIHSFLLNVSQNVLPLSFYPNITPDNSSQNFTAVIDLKDKKLLSKTPNVDVVDFPNSNILVIAHEFFMPCPRPFNVQSKVFNFDNITHNFYYIKHSPFSVRIENESREFLDADLPVKIQELEFNTTKNSLFCYGKTDCDTYVVCIIKHKDKKYSLTTLEEVNLLEIQNDKIVTYKNLSDMLRHGVTKEYSFSPNLQVETVLVKDEISLPIDKKELAPYAFFDAVKCKNFELSRKFLTKELGEKLTDSHIEKFFGNFLFSHQALSQNANEIALVYENTDAKKFAKIFDITQTDNGKISNISEL